MIRHILLLVVPLLIFSSSPGYADSLEAESGSTCQDPQYTYKKFRPETLTDLPFPPGAFVEMKQCQGVDMHRNSDSPDATLNREEIEKENTIKKLSLLLSYIYDQQKNLAGSYQGTDRAYQDLLKRKLPDPKTYDHAVSNYEDALKNYGEYEAYLSALPQAVSDYERKVGSSLKGFAFQKADGAITMMKTPTRIDLSNFQDGMKAKTDEFLFGEEGIGENKPEIGKAKEQKEGERNVCNLLGEFAGSTAENLVLASLSNPMGALLGATLRTTLCSENLYENITGLPKKLGEGLMEMGSYIKAGLMDIGNGLYNIGRGYLYTTPSNMGPKIAESYENTKKWLNRKLGWR